MRVSPRPLPGVFVDVVAVLGAASIAWTAAAAAMRGAAASRPIVLAASALSAVAVGVAVRLATRRIDSKGHKPGIFVVAALAPLGLVALADQRAAAIALASIPATITAVACTILVASVRSARAHGNLDAPERVAIVSGVVASSLSAVLLPFLGWIAALPLGIGLALLAGVVAREAIRARWLARVHSGREPGWSIVHESEQGTREDVPDATGQPLADAVLTYIAPSPDPYRAGRPHVIARVHSKPDALVRAPRVRAGKALFAIVVAGSLAMFGAVAAAEMQRDHRVARTVDDREAPSCSAARPYFKERVEQSPNVAWATLVTHAEDPTLAEGEGVLLVLARSGDVDVEAVLRVANSIPCTGKLALRVEPPRIHPFTVHARLTLTPTADRKAVRMEAERQMAELTDVKAALLVERVGAGADYPTFGWGPSYVLRHLPGVVKAVVQVDGENDVVLEPRELPAVGKLELVDAETGDAL